MQTTGNRAADYAYCPQHQAGHAAGVQSKPALCFTTQGALGCVHQRTRQYRVHSFTVESGGSVSANSSRVVVFRLCARHRLLFPFPASSNHHTITITTPPLPRAFHSLPPTSRIPHRSHVLYPSLSSIAIARSIFAARGYLQYIILANLTRPLAC